VRQTVTCRELIDLLDRYLEGELAPPVAARFAAHLALCPDCVAYLHSYSQTIRLAREAWCADDLVPADVPPALLEAILDLRPLAPGGEGETN
jgi:anti-sigma factor RsiW